MNDMIAVVQGTGKVFDIVNLIYGAIIGALSLIFGEHWLLFAGFLMLNVVDFVSGCYKARLKKELSSEVGMRGAMRKVSYWVVIGVAFFVAGSFVEMGEIIGIDLGFVTLFGWLTLAMYLVNELRSILENFAEMGVEVPEFLIKGLAVTSKMIDSKAGDEDKE